VSRKLTLELGIRYDYQGSCASCGIASAPSIRTSPIPRRRTAWWHGIRGYARHAANCEFPVKATLRLHPAWIRYRLDDKTVIRGGWGSAYGQTANYN